MNISSSPRLIATVLLVAAVGSGTAAHSEVVDAQAGAFTVRESATIAGSADKIWDALAHPGRWWDPLHTYSHDAGNLTVVLEPGGSWQEALPGGGVRHLQVINAQPGRQLRLEGALGPLQAFGVTGHLTLDLKGVAGGTNVTQTYDVGAHAPGGLDQLAVPVDRVLGDQLARLKRFVETGRAE